eukprot:1570811-Rhodomonas_salina.1
MCIRDSHKRHSHRSISHVIALSQPPPPPPSPLALELEMGRPAAKKSPTSFCSSAFLSRFAAFLAHRAAVLATFGCSNEASASNCLRTVKCH